MGQDACWLHRLHLRTYDHSLHGRLVPTIHQLLVSFVQRVCLAATDTHTRAVPTPNIQCSAAINHLITNAIFNLSSDVILLIIALPMFIKTQMPVRKKAALCGVFGLGIFVMIAAILNKYYSFTNPFGSQWIYWYCRESSTSLLVTNLPFVYTLFRRLFKLRSLDSSGVGYATGSRRLTGQTGTRTGKGTLMSRIRHDPEAGYPGPFSAVATMITKEEKNDAAFFEADGITKEVDVTFESTPAWLDEFKPQISNRVVITAGEVSPDRPRSPVTPPAEAHVHRKSQSS